MHHFTILHRQNFSYGGSLRFSPYLTHGQQSADILAPASGTDHVHTGFAQDELELGPKVTLNVGEKLQHNNFSHFYVQPSARVLLLLGKHQSLWAGVTRAVTTPSDLEENFFVVVQEAPNTFLQVLKSSDPQREVHVEIKPGLRAIADRAG